MAIFRGIGGAGDSNTDATLTAVTEKAVSANNSASAAASSASSAASSASSASSSATNAASSASAASSSAISAASSASSASSSESAASDSQLAAAISQTAAGVSETNAAISESNASDSADAAAASEAAAAASELAAATSETNAAASETSAASSASAASSSASAAASSASAAATSETNAAASEAAAAASFDAFDDRYLGAKALDPIVDNDGNALITGALYYNTTNNVMKVYDGSWVAAYASLSGALLSSNNLSDVSSASTSRTNIGLGSSDSPTFYGLTTTDGATVGGNLVVQGDLTVNGTTTTINAENLAVSDNLIYLNDGNETSNIDVGITGNYNDGTYAHTGFFRDATDGVWKAFDGYTPEPDAAVDIDTTHGSFSLAPIQASEFIGNASTATKLATARTLSVSGDMTGSASFDGSGNADIDVTINPAITLDSTFHTFETTGTSGTVNLDLGTTNVWKLTPSGNVTITVSNADSAKASIGVIEITGGGDYVVSFPAAWKWNFGQAPTLGTGTSVDIIVFITTDGGTSYRAARVQTHSS